MLSKDIWYKIPMSIVKIAVLGGGNQYHIAEPYDNSKRAIELQDSKLTSMIVNMLEAEK